jgi:hypothetical protein
MQHARGVRDRSEQVGRVLEDGAQRDRIAATGKGERLDRRFVTQTRAVRASPIAACPR